MTDNHVVIIFYEFKPEFWEKRFKSELNYYKKLTDKNRLVILDLTDLCFKKSKNFYNHIDEDVDYIKISSKKDLDNFFKNKNNVFLLNFIMYSLNSLYIFLLIKRYGAKVILINNRGFTATTNTLNYNFFDRIKYYMNYKSTYYCNRLLSILNVIPRIEYYFESSKVTIDRLQNSFSFKLFKKFDGLINIKFINKIVRVNSKIYDELLEEKFLTDDKKIVLIDSGFDHGDRYMREYKNNSIVSSQNREIYYESLYKFLIALDKKTGLKICFCKHPASIYPNKGFFKKIEEKYYSNYSADKLLPTGKIIIFTGGSTMINKAITYKKKIIILRSKLTGSYKNNTLDSFLSLISLKVVNLDKFKSIDDNFMGQLDDSLNLYEEHIKKNIIFEKNKKSYDQIKEILNISISN